MPEQMLPNGLPLYAQSMEALKLMQKGGQSHSDLYRAVGREVPEALQLYESLGRFRDALLAHEWHNEVDATRRARYGRIIQLYSACFADPRGARVTAVRSTSAP
jgi:hypothetical protein